MSIDFKNYFGFVGEKIFELGRTVLSGVEGGGDWGWTYTKHGPGVHGPPHGPGPWTTPNFQKDIAPINIKLKIYQRSGYENHRLVFIAYVIEGLPRKSGLLWDCTSINGKTTNLF